MTQQLFCIQCSFHCSFSLLKIFSTPITPSLTGAAETARIRSMLLVGELTIILLHLSPIVRPIQVFPVLALAVF
ncbi:uncharacterized protein YALI1_F10285g [Yarrowia lipolytica]|uniref:Uncharacterized protein n=1 Tax=Yarrowia lipolytica TaxID=4952 RepID=A0A1D8NMD4_YARLL|nr:hypothetical protein YALI1_F10285g [Yarrowia lipolytica]